MRKPNAKEQIGMINICIYLHDHEKNHWEKSDKPKNHIYKSIKIVEKYLDAIKK